MVVENPFGPIRKVETAEQKALKAAAEELGMSVEQYREYVQRKKATEAMGKQLKEDTEADKNRPIRNLN